MKVIRDILHYNVVGGTHRIVVKHYVGKYDMKLSYFKRLIREKEA